MRKFMVAALLPLLFLVGCSSIESAGLADKNKAFRDYLDSTQIASVNKVNSFRFHGWQSLTDEFLIISASPKRRFLIELSGYCHDVRWAHTIMINRGTHSTLHARFDSVSTISAPEVKCMIKNIYPITKEQVAEIQAINNPSEQ